MRPIQVALATANMLSDNFKNLSPTNQDNQVVKKLEFNICKTVADVAENTKQTWDKRAAGAMSASKLEGFLVMVATAQQPSSILSEANMRN